MKALTRITLAAVLVAALLLACGDGITPPPLPPELPLPKTSPANVLMNVGHSFRTMDYYLFKTCLATTFVFYNNPNDVGKEVGGYLIPAVMDYASITRAAWNMFVGAYSIRMDIPTDGVGTPGSDDRTWRADNVIIRLTVMADPGSGYRIGGGYCNFEFERYANDGEYRWRLTKWWDNTNGGTKAASAPGVEPSSLGRILAVFLDA